jgi:hypothetical protein
MSNIIHKVKDAVTHKNKSTDQTTDSHVESNQSTNHGPHDSNVANTADPRVDSARSAHNTTGTSTGHSSTQPIGTGASHNTHESGRSSNHGPHDSNIANTADPRVDSDRSAHNTTGTSTGHSSTQPIGTGASQNAYESGRSSNHGPHDSNIANTADPRIDSDRDSSAAYGAGSTGLNSGSTGLNSGSHAGSHVGSTGLNSGSHSASTGGLNSGSTGLNTGSTGLNTGSHTGSHAGSTGLNAASHTGSTGLNSGSHTGSTGYGSAAPLTGANESGLSSNHGPHDSNIANTADPRIDSDRSSSAAFGAGSTGLNSGSTGLNSGSHTGSHSASTGGLNSGSTGLNTGSHTGSNVGSTGLNAASHTGSTGLNSGSHTGSHSGSTGYGSAEPLTGANSNVNESSRSSNHGPHDSNIANKADPRVDSDRSKQHNFNDDVHKGSIAGAADMAHLSGGNSGPDTSTRTFEEAHETGAEGVNHPHHTPHGAGSSYNQSSTRNSTAGPHDSNVANKIDPRVDSDRDGSKTVGETQYQRL